MRLRLGRLCSFFGHPLELLVYFLELVKLSLVVNNFKATGYKLWDSMLVVCLVCVWWMSFISSCIQIALQISDHSTCCRDDKI